MLRQCVPTPKKLDQNLTIWRSVFLWQNIVGLTHISPPKNVMDALEQAIAIRSDGKYRRIFHSDQGWAYQMKAYSHRLKEERIFQSMSRKGNCHDNSVMENFFGLLKHLNKKSIMVLFTIAMMS